MKISIGSGVTKYGPGVDIELEDYEIVNAINAYLIANGAYVSGPRTIKIHDELVTFGRVYVDPSGFVIHDGRQYLGSGGIKIAGR